MKLFRIIVAVLFVLTTIATTLVFVKEKLETDTTIPEITVEGELIDVSLKATDEELLKGITAYDGKDKDLTDKVIVESISRFIEKGVCKVTYAVCDSDNNVAKATRKIRYSGYESPKYKVSGNLCFSLYEHIDIREYISVTDSLEGDLSEKIVVTSDNYSASISGAFDLEVSVTTLKGDESIITLPLIIEDRPISVPQIELKEYLVYLNKGTSVDFRSYLINDPNSPIAELIPNVTIESNVDFNKPGTYHVHYYVTDENGNRGHSIMTVIVEE